MAAALSAIETASGGVAASILSISTDIFVVGAIFVALLVFALWKGQGSLATLTLSIIAAIGIYTAFPYRSLFTASAFIPIAVFILFVGVVYFVLSGLISVFAFGGGIGQWVQTALLAALTTTLIVATTYHVVSIAPLYTWSGAIAFLFKSNASFFWWLLAPFAILYFI